MSAVLDNRALAAPEFSGAVTDHAPKPPVLRNNALMDAMFRNITRLFAFLVFSLLAAIVVSLAVGSMPSIHKFGLDFLWSDRWDPVKEDFGALVPIYGTLVTSAIALLAAIPSIIYGMWGFFVFAPIFQQHVQPLLAKSLGQVAWLGTLFSGPPMGIGMLAAGIILAVMVIPFITAVMRDVFELVPAMLKESSYALGSTTSEVVWRVVLPFTKVGVIGVIMLGLGLALS